MKGNDAEQHVSYGKSKYAYEKHSLGEQSRWKILLRKITVGSGDDKDELVQNYISDNTNTSSYTFYFASISKYYFGFE